MSFESLITERGVEFNIFKEVDAEGQKTVSPDNADELSRQAKDFIHFARHPYTKSNYPTTYSLNRITMNGDGEVVFADGRHTSDRKYADYYRKLLEMSKNPDNPLATFPALIAMELDIPDYDTDKNNAKIVGKRTSKLLNTLISDLKKGLKRDKLTYEVTWPSGAKRAFLKGKSADDFSSAKVSRIVKQGQDVTVYVTTVKDNGQRKVTAMKLQGNISVDTYANVWRIVAEKTKP